MFKLAKNKHILDHIWSEKLSLVSFTSHSVLQPDTLTKYLLMLKYYDYLPSIFFAAHNPVVLNPD